MPYSVLAQIEEATGTLTVTKVSKILGVKPVTIYRMVKEGTLPALDTGSAKVLFDPCTLAYWLEQKNPVSVKAARAMKGAA